MAQISNKTLEYISGEYGVNTSTQLLDNTIATMTHKMNQKSQKQLGDLRNMQIKQAMNEQAEYEKNLYLKDLTRQVQERTAKDTLQNLESDLEMSRNIKNFEYATAQSEARFSIYDQLLGATDTASRNTVLDNATDILTPEEIAEMRNIPVGGASWDKKVNQMIQDRPHQQKMAQIIAKEKYTAQPSIKYGSNITARVGALEKQGVQARHANAITTLTDGMGKEGFGDPALLDDLARNLYLADKERYTSDVPGQLTGEQFDRFTMKEDIIRIINGEKLPTKLTSEQSAAPWVEFGKTRDQWEEVKRVNGWTDEQMVQYAREREGR